MFQYSVNKYSGFLLAVFLLSAPALAEDNARDHAPAGVMGDHLHDKGEWMLSARWMRMEMKGNLKGSDDISDAEIIGLPNPNHDSAAMPMTPRSIRNLSVVPQDMEMEMLMLGAMYAPSDRLTLMGMAMFGSKSMRLDTYRGMPNAMGERPLLGDFRTESSSLQSLSLSALIPLQDLENSRSHVQLGLEKSLGDRDEEDRVLAPNNMRPDMRLPYSMQSGDGAWRMSAGLTWVGQRGSFTQGAQFRWRGAVDSKDWNFGDEFLFTGWLQKELREETAASLRLSWEHQDAVEGRDRRIAAPVQTADPAAYGGQTVAVSLGLNQLLRPAAAKHSHRLGVELTFPVYQHLNGPQMEDDWSLLLSWQKTLGD